MRLKYTYCFAFVLITLTTLAGCSGPESRIRLPDILESGQLPYDNSISEQLPQDEKEAQYIPWQLWQNGQTLNGISFSDKRVEAGDIALSKSDYSSSLNSYKVARASNIDESESLAIRIATLELIGGDAPKSILSFSKFFKFSKLSEADISPTSALFFGYAYGQARNYEQSLAWFSQAIRSDENIAVTRAKSGIQALLRIIPTPALEEMGFLWKGNNIISRLISEERFTRQSRPQIVLASQAFFWSLNQMSEGIDQNSASMNQTIFKKSGSRKVAALLPLSGKFAKMGESLKQGLELAEELSANRNTALEIAFTDYGSDSALTAAGLTKESVIDDLAIAGASVIVGPIISERASDVADSARKNGIPAIILAKGGNATLGGNIYRFGLTYESQANSLIAKILQYRSNPRIALIYPKDESGIGFSSAVQSTLRDNSVNLIAEYAYTKGDSAEMLALVPELEINPPEFVIFGDNLKAATAFFAAFSPKVKKGIIPVGSALWDNPVEIIQSKTILKGAIFVSPFYPDLSNPLISEFVARYKEKFSKTPDFFAAQGYDLGLILSSSTNQDNNIFFPPEYSEGVSGIAKTSSYGEINRSLSVLRLANGTISPLTEIPEAKVANDTSEETQLENNEKQTAASIAMPANESGDSSAEENVQKQN